MLWRFDKDTSRKLGRDCDRMGFWSNMANRIPPGPIWELPNGKQLKLDYKAVSVLHELAESSGGGETQLQMNYYSKETQRPSMAEVVWLHSDTERIFCEYFVAYARSDADLMELPGGFPAPNDPDITAKERWEMVWQADWSTSMTWEWTIEELKHSLESWKWNEDSGYFYGGADPVPGKPWIGG
jgi:hypothetical protein